MQNWKDTINEKAEAIINAYKDFYTVIGSAKQLEDYDETDAEAFLLVKLTKMTKTIEGL